ncbi:MAG: hypothetical protein HY236_04640 [Acidobacteria bacterium]|nr:hypothetical protein [Acidobacteriota bacterium]
MPDSFDAYHYFNHLRARWRLPAATLAVALFLSLAISLILPRRYTGKVALVIEPPGASDPRASTAVSSIYLESLKTYEHFAASDHIFAQAVERFQLRRAWPHSSIESLKRDVLQVSMPRDTKILQIAATFPDPRVAHALALYLAEETVKLNRETNRAGVKELVEEAQKQAEQASRRLNAAEAARRQAGRRPPTLEERKAELEQLREQRTEIERLALVSEASIAELEAREKSTAATAGTDSVAERSRLERLRRQTAEIDRLIAARQKMLAERTAESQALEAEYEAAAAASEQWEKRLRELRSEAGLRGERLAILDPGVVPERPSSPNIPLNLLVAVALGVIASLFYLTLEFGFQSQKAESLRKSFRVASKP